MGLLQCYHTTAPFLLALNNSVSMMFVLGADRLLSVVAPVWWVMPSICFMAVFSHG